MTNKTVLYYIVSESELGVLRSEAFVAGFCDTGESEDIEAVDKVEAACRARPISLDRLEKLEAVVKVAKELNDMYRAEDVGQHFVYELWRETRQELATALAALEEKE